MLNYITERQGWVEVVCGSMYSGKTDELIRRLKRATIAKQKVITFKPNIDDRYHKKNIVSHDQNSFEAITIDTPEEILHQAKDADVVGIDEGQFMGMGLVDVVNKLASAGKRVIIAGLDMDYLGNPFSPIPELMAIAEHVQKEHAICVVCGNPANYSQRVVPEEDLIAVGSTGMYEARCRLHFVKPKEI
jgi:thymidine kinase